MNRIARLAAVILAGGMLLLSAPAVYPHGLEQEVENLLDTEVGVLVNNEPYTVGQLKILLTVREAPYRRGEFLFFGLADLANMGLQDPTYRHLAAQARADGYSISPEERARIQYRARNMARNFVYRREIMADIPPPAENVLLELYEGLKDSVLRMEERWILREIHLPITDPEFEETALQQMEQAWNRLESGESFLAVMEDVNPPGTRNVARIILPETDEETPPEVREAFLSIGNRRYSRPVRSSRGLHMVYRQMRIPADYIPFDSAREFLLERYQETIRDQRIDAFLRPLVMDQRLVNVHLANLESRGYLALDDDIIVRVGGKPFVRRELAAAAGWRFSPEVRHGERRVREMLLDVGPVQEALLDIIVDRDSILESPDIAYYSDAAEVTLLVRQYLRKQYNPEEDTPSREEIGGFFRSNRETFPAEPVVYGKRMTALAPGMDSASLVEAGAGMATVERFFEGLRELEGIDVQLSDPDVLDGTSIGVYTEEDRERILATRAGGGVNLVLEDGRADIFIIDRIEGLDYPLPQDEAEVIRLLEIEKYHWFVDRTVNRLGEEQGYHMIVMFPM